MSSLRSRLVLGTLAGITPCLALTGALIFASVRTLRYRDLDRTLEATVHSLVPHAIFEAGDDRPRRPGGELETPRAPGFRHEGTYYQCWTSDGESFAKSEELGELDLAPLEGPPREVVFGTRALPDGLRGRAAGLRILVDRGRLARDHRRGRPFHEERPPRLDEPGSPGSSLPRDAVQTDGADEAREPVDAPPDLGAPDDPRPRGRFDRRGGGPVALDLVVARDTTDVDADLAELRWMLVLGWLTSSLGCTLVVTWVVGRGLRPVEGLRRQLSSLDEGRLDHRFEVANTPAELVPVVDQLNALIARLGKAFEREQTLTAHAAHELRTPLTGLRSTLEVALGRPRGPDEYREAARDCLDITLAMQTMVERLLELSRSGELRVENAPLAELIDEAWEPHRADASLRDMSLAARIPEGLEVRTDLEGLSRVLANLLENAIHYADPGGTIDVRATRTERGVRIVVANDAHEAPRDLADHAFDAFWRADSSRTDVGVHAGLGLSLCKRIVEVLGGRIDAVYEDDRFAVTVDLPDAEAPEEATP